MAARTSQTPPPPPPHPGKKKHQRGKKPSAVDAHVVSVNSNMTWSQRNDKIENGLFLLEKVPLAYIETLNFRVWFKIQIVEVVSAALSIHAKILVLHVQRMLLASRPLPADWTCKASCHTVWGHDCQSQTNVVHDQASSDMNLMNKLACAQSFNVSSLLKRMKFEMWAGESQSYFMIQWRKMHQSYMMLPTVVMCTCA